MRLLAVIMALAMLAGCEPDRRIMESRRETPTPAAEASKTPEPPAKFTLAELIDRVVNAPKDAFLYPCDLNSQGDANREKLRELAAKWQDDKYIVAADTGCVCPSFCLLAVEDASLPAPKNSGLLVLDGNPPARFVWAARGMDLTGATLSWIDAVPQVTFKDADGTATKICSVEAVKGGYVTKCADANGKKLPSL